MRYRFDVFWNTDKTDTKAILIYYDFYWNPCFKIRFICIPFFIVL